MFPNSYLNSTSLNASSQMSTPASILSTSVMAKRNTQTPNRHSFLNSQASKNLFLNSNSSFTNDQATANMSINRSRLDYNFEENSLEDYDDFDDDTKVIIVKSLPK